MMDKQQVRAWMEANWHRHVEFGEVDVWALVGEATNHFTIRLVKNEAGEEDVPVWLVQMANGVERRHRIAARSY